MADVRVWIVKVYRGRYACATNRGLCCVGINMCSFNQKYYGNRN